MTDIFTHMDQITPAWLTSCLQGHGLLSNGHVVSLSGREETTAIGSVICQIAVHYSDDATPSAPRQLFLKSGSSDEADNDDWRGEVEFYSHIAIEDATFAVPCYHATYASQPAQFHLLLADLSATHARAQWPLPATHQQLEQAIDCLAQLHISWWEHPRLGRDVQPRFVETSLDQWLKTWEEQLTSYLGFVGDRLSPRRRALYEWALPRLLTRLLQRRKDGQHYTIAHQDAHPYNFLFPHGSPDQSTRLVDWATWDVELGARDLAYLIALHLFPEERKLVEQPLLQRYQAHLHASGIHSYSWKQLWDDYRLFVIWNLFVPVEQFCFHVPAYIWWGHVERSFLAFDDLRCSELLEAV